ncbi:MAG TPA: YciI family protein [Jiangellaceae bacterium]
MRYAMLIIGNEADWDSMDAAAHDAAMADIFAWFEKWGAAGKIADGGAELASSNEGRTVRGGVVTDGPFMESKEVIGGVTFLDADSLDEAVEIAAGWPGVAEGRVAIEVRPIIEH